MDGTGKEWNGADLCHEQPKARSGFLNGKERKGLEWKGKDWRGMEQKGQEWTGKERLIYLIKYIDKSQFNFYNSLVYKLEVYYEKLQLGRQS